MSRSDNSSPAPKGATLKQAARAVMDKLSGPDRVEVISHYLGSAKKACAAAVRSPWFCDGCGETLDRCPCDGES